MPRRLYRGDPLTPEEREEFEEDLIAFCDRELDLLGDVRDLDVLYAGGSSPLWLEGLSQRIGERGSLTALDLDAGDVREALRDADLAAPIRLVAGDVFEPPFKPRTFDLVYSAGLWHELDVRARAARAALAALVLVIRPGGRVATSDFVDTVPAAQLEEEELEADLARLESGGEAFGIGSPERLAALHTGVLSDLRWRVLQPHGIRHMGKVFLADETLGGRVAGIEAPLRGRWLALQERVRREGYTRPATAYVEGTVPCGFPPSGYGR